MAKKLPPPPADPVVKDRQRGKFAGADDAKHNLQKLMRTTAQPRGPPNDEDDDDAVVFTIRSFCRSHRISEAFYHKLCGMGLGPRVMRAGRRVLISKESAAEWRREREAAAEAAE